MSWRACRRRALAAIMLMLLALAGCGQMGPLQLPEAPATTSGDQDSDDDER